MRGVEIIRALGYVPSDIARAILDLDARAHLGNGGPKRLNEVTLHPRLMAAVKRAGGVAKAADSWGCSRTHIYDVIDGKRPPGPLLQSAIGIRRVSAGITEYEVLD